MIGNIAAIFAPLIRAARLAAWPVGSIYTSVEATNPGTLFGGTWERIQGRFLIGQNSTYAAGSTGGAATVSLTRAQLPKISGAITAGAGTYGATNGGYGAFRSCNGVFSAGAAMQYARARSDYAEGWPNSEAGIHSVSMSFGNNDAHNNMPPYLSVYMWKRTA